MTCNFYWRYEQKQVDYTKKKNTSFTYNAGDQKFKDYLKRMWTKTTRQVKNFRKKIELLVKEISASNKKREKVVCNYCKKVGYLQM